jgi:hypothetical protein
MSRFTIANGLVFGEAPNALKELNDVELALFQRLAPINTFFRFLVVHTNACVDGIISMKPTLTGLPVCSIKSHTMVATHYDCVF